MPREKKLTLEEVYYLVESEGLGYAVQYHTDASCIADKELAKYWEQAKEALDNIESILSEVELPEEDEDEQDL